MRAHTKVSNIDDKLLNDLLIEWNDVALFNSLDEKQQHEYKQVMINTFEFNMMKLKYHMNIIIENIKKV